MCPCIAHLSYSERACVREIATGLDRPSVMLPSMLALLAASLVVAIMGLAAPGRAMADTATGSADGAPTVVNADVPQSPFVALGRAVRPAVVSIRITRAVGVAGVDQTPLQELYRRFFPDREGEGGRFENPGTGSGFVVDPAGAVLTNHHVIAGADQIYVRFPGEVREYVADMVGSDSLTDLALLRIDPEGRDLPSLAFGSSDHLDVGDWVVAVGNPFGNLEGSMTVGVLSAKGRGDLSIQGLTPRYQDFLQTDASINFGNSGGPLVDIHGLVIGVNTAVNSVGQGIGFAVPSRMVQHVYNQLDTHGRVIRGWLGAAAHDAGGGVVVVGSVVPDSPAAVADLRKGDRMVAFGKHPVTSQRQLLFLVAGAPIDQPQTVTVERDGQQMTLTVTLTELDPANLNAADSGAWLGLEVADLAGDDPRVVRLRESYGIDSASGVMIVSAEAGRPGSAAGLRPGDVLVAVEDRDLPDLAAWKAAAMALRGQRDALNVLVRTGTNERFVQVTPRGAGTLQ